MTFLQEVCTNYSLLVMNEKAHRLTAKSVTTTAEVVNTLHSLSVEQLACVFEVPPHSAPRMMTFINSLLGADVSPSVVKFVNGFDLSQRVSMDCGGIMTIGVLLDLAVSKLVLSVIGLQAADGLPYPMIDSTNYCLFTAAVGWAIGGWAAGQLGNVLGKRKIDEAASSSSSRLNNLSVLYAHDVCVHDKSKPLDELLKAYLGSGLINSNMSSSTWITPSPAANVLKSDRGVFWSQASGDVAMHLGAARELVDSCHSSNAPFDFVTTLLSDNSLGQLVSKASIHSDELVEIPVGILKPVLIMR